MVNLTTTTTITKKKLNPPQLFDTIQVMYTVVDFFKQTKCHITTGSTTPEADRILADFDYHLLYM